MPINPVHFAHEICAEFLRYIRSAFPLTDPELAEQARGLLKRPSALDIPLVKGPYVSLSEAFAKGGTVSAMAEKGTLHPVMPELIGYPSMWRHQEDVFKAVKEGRHVLVATGTGSGKTESFLYPILDDLLRRRDQGEREGVAAILVYPMNALANDQLDRLRDMLGGTEITFAQWVGSTPAKAGDSTVERFDGSGRQAYLEARRKRLEEAQAEDRAARPLAPPEECLSEDEIRQRKPRVLLTNYRQLEVLTTRLPDVALFADAPIRHLVFDEAHTYGGATGAEVACLIRRVRSLAGKSADEILCIGTSATLSDPTREAGDDDDDDQAARRFASRFFGVDPERVALIGESHVRREWPKNRYKPVAPSGDGMDRLARVLKAIGEPVDLEAVGRVVEELTGQIFEPGDDWREALFDHLASNEYVRQATEILKHPQRLDEAAARTSRRVSHSRPAEGEGATTELLAYLILGAAARKGGESLLRPKVHFFLRGLDEMVAALDGADSETKPRLFLSLADAKERLGDRRDDAFLPVLACRGCGQHFFETHILDLELTRGANNRLRSFENGNAVQDAFGQDNAWWTPTPEGTGARLVLTNRLLEEAEDGPTARSVRWPRAFFCRQCGAMHRAPSARCLADGCGHAEPLLPLIVFGSSLSARPSCNTPSFPIGGRTVEPARKIRAVTVSDVHILAQAMINHAPDGHKKLIIFADSRQDAAFQAGWMQDHARRIRLRHMMREAITEAGGPQPLNEVIDRLMGRFRKDQNLIDTLLPELTTEEAPAIFGSKKMESLHKALRYMVLREFTTSVRRADCLESMGLARVDHEGVTPESEGPRRWAEMLGISPEEAVEAVSLLLDNWRRSRYLYVADDPIFSKYHRKDDPYIQAGLLNLRDFHPGGLVLKESKSPSQKKLIAGGKGSIAQVLIKRWAAHPESLDVDAAVGMLWEFLTAETKILKKSHAPLAEREAPSGRLAGGPGAARRRPSASPGALRRLPEDHDPQGS